MAVMTTVMLTSDRRIELRDRPEPHRRHDQVIVDVDLCGICGSDLHSPDLPQVYRGGFTLGHEAAGVLSWVGDEVEGWTVGQRVAVNGNVDGTCEHCRAGHPDFCRQATMDTALGLQMDGGLAPRMAAFPGSLRAVPEGMSRYAAAWVEPTATALRAVGLAGDLTGADVLVTGGGPIGQLVLRWPGSGASVGSRSSSPRDTDATWGRRRGRMRASTPPRHGETSGTCGPTS